MIIKKTVITLAAMFVVFVAQAQMTDSQRQAIVEHIADNMVYVEGGVFTMGATKEQGDDANDDERPAHKVTLSSFRICRFEVTQREWRAVMGSNPSKLVGDDLPVENVDLGDCQRFIKKLNSMTGLRFRLPTEAEWEYAARGGSKSQGYNFAGSDEINDVAWFYFNSKQSTHSVGTKQPNELGLYDMSGNVFEWCPDLYGKYPSSPQTNPVGPVEGADHVCRGGGWSYYNTYCRVSCRDKQSCIYNNSNLGFRLAL